MASQDNPEQGLCHHPSAPRPVSETSKSTLPKRSLEGTRAHQQGSRRKDTPETRSSESVGKFTEELSPKRKESKRKTSAEDVLRKRTIPDLSIPEEPTNTDPRSFVQNVFGTVAFKMLEWLTPRNIDVLIKARGGEGSESENIVSCVGETTKTVEALLETPSSSENPSSPTTSDSSEDKENRSTDKKTNSNRKSEPSAPPAAIPNPQLSHAREPKLPPGTDSHPSSVSKLLTRHDHLDSQHLKGILTKSPKQAEITSDISHQPRQYVSPVQRRLSHQSSSTNSRVVIQDTPVMLSPSAPKTKTSKADSQSSILEYDGARDGEHQMLNSQVPTQHDGTIQHEGDGISLRVNELSLLPQSLSHFTIETLEFLCDLMQAEGISEHHPLYPVEIAKQMTGKRKTSPQLSRVKDTKNIQQPSTKHAWKAFIEQSFFDVLSRPDSLLRSFRDEKGHQFDTQTIWYLMLRMTRVAPSIVFDSLWRLAGGLFQPPEQLKSTCEWPKDESSTRSQQPVSNSDAAEAISLCLHALIAAAPLVTDQQQLASMSRIRSYGLAMRGSESSSPEHIQLCLQYEDAFTYDLAMRLARRLFSAIPIRRRFTELLELQKDVRDDEKPEPDVLEMVIKSLNLDLDAESILNFSDEERGMHEKRVPTLILDWARTVMLQEWQGAAEVPSDGAFGGALAMINAMYENRKALLLGDIHFRTEYFAERLDPVDMPIGWLAFESNKRTVHLLDYPYLFNSSTLVTYFRALNYSRMNRAYEMAKANGGLMYSTIAENSLMTDKYRRDRLYQKLETATTRFNVLEIGRTDVLKDTFDAIWRREERELLRPLKVRLGQDDGDEGMDSGGVQQEFFRLAIAEAVNPAYGAFTIDTITQMIWFQPGSPEPLWKFELIGMLVSLAVYNGLTLPVTFPKAFYRKLLDQEVTELHHIGDGWPVVADGLTDLLEWDEKNGSIEDVFVLTYEFSSNLFGKPISREMGTLDQWPQFSDSQSSSVEEAPMVTNENRNSYVSDYIRWLTDISIRPQFSAFRKGFFSCIDRRSISLFDADTLQSVVEGIQEIDISEMRRTAQYVGWPASHRTVRDFWSIVKRYSLEQKKKLLEFTTASDRVPVGGMRNLQFTLQKNGVDDNHLPTSYTCYGILLLPEYSSKEVLREKLAMALENSKGFGFA